MEQDKFVINIGRQLGSGGKAVGEALGRRLGVHVYDKQLINLAAEQSGLCTELFEQADEKKSRSLFSSLIGYLRMPFGGDECGMTDVLSSEALFKIQSDVIRDIASRESCIFVGRCADYILRDHPRAVNVFVTGAPEDRVRRLCEQENVTPEEAEAYGCPQGFLLRLFQQRQVGRSRNLPSLHRFLGAGDRRYGRLYPGVRGA